MGQWFVAIMAVTLARVSIAQVPEPDLPRPGIMVVADLTGSVTVNYGEQPKAARVEERLRAGAVVATGRRSLLKLMLSNGATIELGSDSELEIDEFGQMPYLTSTIKIAEMKEEPSVSRTRLQLLRGDVKVKVQPLKVSRGSSFTLRMLAGTVKTGQGVFAARIQMSEFGIGMYTLELVEGAAQFEPVGGTFQPLRLGKRLGIALEVDSRTGSVKLGEMPQPAPLGKE